MSDESTATEKTSPDQIVRALDTIVHAVLASEIDAIRSSISDLDARQSERIAALEQSTSNTVDHLQRDLLSRIEELSRQVSESRDGSETLLADLERNGQQLDELKQQLDEARTQAEARVDAMKDVLEQELGSRDRSIQEMKERLEAAGDLEPRLGGVEAEMQQVKERFEAGHGQVDNRLEEIQNTVEKQLTAREAELLELSERFDTTHGQVEGRIESVKQALEQELTVREADLRDQMSAISRNIESVKLELQQHQDNSKRFSLLLNNLAAVFTGEQGSSSAVREALASARQHDSAPAVAPPENTDAPENMNGEVDSALDRVFPGDS